MVKIKPILCLFLLIFVFSMPVDAKSQGRLQVIPISRDSWTCYDNSINFMKENPDYGCLTMCNHRFFRGVSHMVNYKIDPKNPTVLEIHDGLFGVDYNIYDWQTTGTYYYFWIDETPIRNYNFLRDNSKALLETLSETV